MVGYARRARVYSILKPSTAYSVESETGVVEERLASLKRVTDSDIEFAKRPRHWHSSKWPNTDNRRYTEQGANVVMIRTMPVISISKVQVYE